jgi:hypothetical protein
MVNTEPLAYALNEAGLIDRRQGTSLKDTKIPHDRKSDPELPDSLPPRVRARKEELLQHGLSDSYVGLCFDAYEKAVVSAGRLAEMLLASETEVQEIALLYGKRLAHVD